MATSGTVAFRPDVEEVIAEAFERVGIDDQTRTGYHAKAARRSLNLLFSEFANRGINYWTVQNNTLSLTSGTTTYTLPAGTIDFIDVVIRENNVDTAMIQGHQDPCRFGAKPKKIKPELASTMPFSLFVAFAIFRLTGDRILIADHSFQAAITELCP